MTMDRGKSTSSCDNDVENVDIDDDGTMGGGDDDDGRCASQVLGGVALALRLSPAGGKGWLFVLLRFEVRRFRGGKTQQLTEMGGKGGRGKQGRCGGGMVLVECGWAGRPGL
jgi:hypothetical protein